MLIARRAAPSTRASQRVTAAMAAAAAASAPPPDKPRDSAASRRPAAPADDRPSPAARRKRFGRNRLVRIVCIVCSVLFVLTTCANLTLTIYALNVRLTRLAQINFGYQIVFLMPFIPFIFGILFENRELLVPFFVINVYSIFFNIIITILVNIQLVDIAPLDSRKISGLCLLSAAVSMICAVFIVLLFQRYTKVLEIKQNTDYSDFKINNYSLQRYGDIMTLE